MSTSVTDDGAWASLWDALAAAARATSVEPPASRPRVVELARARGGEGLVLLGWGEQRALAENPAHTTMMRVHAALVSVPHVFFKGPLADIVLWGGRGVRGGSDVDVLVLPDDEARAVAALEQTGFARATRSIEGAAHKARLLLPRDPALRPVDLHVRPLNDPPFRSTSADVVAAALTHEGLRFPDVATMIVISAGNLAGGRLQGILRQSADAARAATLFGVEWGRVVELARRWRAGAATWGFLRLLQARLDVDVPAETLAALAPPALVGKAIERAFGVVGAPLEPASVVAGIFAVEWPLSGRASWPAERIVRTGLLRAADKLLSRSSRDDATLPRTMPVALESRVTVPADVMIQEIDGESVLLDLRKETYFGLDEIGTLLFRTLKSEGTLRAALDAGLAAYDVERDTLTRDLLELVEELAEQGLVVVEP